MSVGRGKRVWVTRGIVLAAVIAAGGAIGVVVLTGAAGTIVRDGGPKPDPTAPVPEFVADWHEGNYQAMYALISPRDRAGGPSALSVAFNRAAAKVATRRGLHKVGTARRRGDIVTVPMWVAPRTYGRVPQTMSVPVAHPRRG